MAHHKFIYHITTPLAWNAARRTGFYEVESLQTEGFIHASTVQQVVRTANRFYFAKRGLILLVIEAAKVTPIIKYEESEPNMFFPHIYGPLNMEAVTETVAFEPKMDGYFELPPRLQNAFLDSYLPAF